jgi:hypothetical protein
MKTLTIPSTATRDQRDAFIEKSVKHILRALARMERYRGQTVQHATMPQAASAEGSGHADPRDH